MRYREIPNWLFECDEYYKKKKLEIEPVVMEVPEKIPEEESVVKPKKKPVVKYESDADSEEEVIVKKKKKKSKPKKKIESSGEEETNDEESELTHIVESNFLTASIYILEQIYCFTG